MKTVLVADDEPSIVMSLEFLLRKAGYAVRVARDGAAVLAALEGDAPDLVLLDAMMPERDGFAVCHAIRRSAGWGGVPVIMLTARSREAERQRGLAMGATDYVTKPFSTRDLLDRVRRHLSDA
ncbi:MAG TPA: response regulator [Azospirillaceae bacterium]|nr:response regulator [Azospirillaceae bacterium]